MGINPATFFFEILNFFVLVVILYYLLFRPLQRVLDDRRAAIAKAESDARTARELIESNQQWLASVRQEAQRDRDRILEQARLEATQAGERILAKARQEGIALGQKAELSRSEERQRLLSALESDLAAMALELARRLLLQAADRDLNDQLCAKLAETLENLPSDERDRLARDLGTGERALVQSARPLSGAPLARLQAALYALGGRTLALEIAVVPDLVAGVRVRLAGREWDATLADVLRGGISRRLTDGRDRTAAR